MSNKTLPGLCRSHPRRWAAWVPIAREMRANTSRKARLAVIAFCASLVVSVAACASLPANSDGRARTTVPRQLTTPPPMKDVATACPAQTFDAFLRKFADTDDDRVRQAFTAMPLEYSVPTFTLRDDTTNLPPFTVTHVKTADRGKYFAYRYIQKIGDYRPVGINGESLQEALAEAPGGYKYPVAITEKANGDREVVMGMETEVDIYLFTRQRGCWFLTRATNPRD